MTFKCEKKGHKFQPRYDEYPHPNMDKVIEAFLENTTPRELTLKPTYKTYVHDICVRCGKVIKREEKYS